MTSACGRAERVVAEVVVARQHVHRCVDPGQLIASVLEVFRAVRAVGRDVADVDDQVGCDRVDVGDHGGPVALRLSGFRLGEVRVGDDEHMGGRVVHASTARQPSQANAVRSSAMKQRRHRLEGGVELVEVSPQMRMPSTPNVQRRGSSRRSITPAPLSTGSRARRRAETAGRGTPGAG